MTISKTVKPVAAKQTAMSLHIGLNAVSGAAYGGWTGPLAACEFDANDMAAIATARGMTASVLLTNQATRSAVLSAIRAAAVALSAGDLFFLSYSGHGGQVPDVSGEKEEDDKKDETWCLYDGQVIDDELYVEFSKFKAGVRILIFSDSCHSGTVAREIPDPLASAFPDQRPKRMPEAVAMRTYRENQAFYDQLQIDLKKAAGKAPVDPDAALANVAVSSRLTTIANKFAASVILISGCQDNQTSLDGDHNGAFTEQLLKVWNNGAFKGNYALFHKKILSRMPASQSPNLFTLGPVSKFLAQAPLSV